MHVCGTEGLSAVRRVVWNALGDPKEPIHVINVGELRNCRPKKERKELLGPAPTVFLFLVECVFLKACARCARDPSYS